MAYIYEVADPQAKIAELTAKAAENGIVVSGDSLSGNISGMGLKGGYSVTGNIITIDVTDKPFFISDNMLKSNLDKFMGKE